MKRYPCALGLGSWSLRRSRPCGPAASVASPPRPRSSWPSGWPLPTRSCRRRLAPSPGTWEREAGGEERPALTSPGWRSARMGAIVPGGGAAARPRATARSRSGSARASASRSSCRPRAPAAWRSARTGAAPSTAGPIPRPTRSSSRRRSGWSGSSCCATPRRPAEFAWRVELPAGLPTVWPSPGGPGLRRRGRHGAPAHAAALRVDARGTRREAELGYAGGPAHGAARRPRPDLPGAARPGGRDGRLAAVPRASPRSPPRCVRTAHGLRQRARRAPCSSAAALPSPAGRHLGVGRDDVDPAPPSGPGARATTRWPTTARAAARCSSAADGGSAASAATPGSGTARPGLRWPRSGPPATLPAMRWPTTARAAATVLFGGWTSAAAASATPGSGTGRPGPRGLDAGPAARYGHALAYDSARGSGRSSSAADDGSATSATPGSGTARPGRRSRRTRTAGARRPRPGLRQRAQPHRCSSAASAQRHLLGDTWEWDGTTWTQRGLDRAARRAIGHAMAYDSARGQDRALRRHQSSTAPYLGDTWEWDGTAWTQAGRRGPPARRSHALAYDSARAADRALRRLRPTPACGDTWEWDGPAWTQVRPRPGRRRAASHALAYDSARGRTVLFGGDDGCQPPRRHLGVGRDAPGPSAASTGPAGARAATRWPTTARAAGRCSSAAATARATSATPGSGTGRPGPRRAATGPAARVGHALAYDSARGRTVLFGGYATAPLPRRHLGVGRDGLDPGGLDRAVARAPRTRWPTTARAAARCSSAARGAAADRRHLGVGRDGLDPGGLHRGPRRAPRTRWPTTARAAGPCSSAGGGLVGRPDDTWEYHTPRRPVHRGARSASTATAWTGSAARPACDGACRRCDPAPDPGRVLPRSPAATDPDTCTEPHRSATPPALCRLRDGAALHRRGDRLRLGLLRRTGSAATRPAAAVRRVRRRARRDGGRHLQHAAAGYPGNPGVRRRTPAPARRPTCAGTYCTSDLYCGPDYYCAAGGHCQPRKGARRGLRRGGGRRLPGRRLPGVPERVLRRRLLLRARVQRRRATCAARRPGPAPWRPRGAAGSPSCVAYLCSGTSADCPTSCADDDDCAAGYFCGAGGTCQPRRSTGQTCGPRRLPAGAVPRVHQRQLRGRLLLQHRLRAARATPAT